MHVRHARIGGLLVLAVAAVAAMTVVLGGCNGGMSGEVAVMDPLAAGSQADLQRETEVEMVEQMARSRGRYVEYLRLLEEFYSRQGNHMKARWAGEELRQYQSGPHPEYLVVAETAGPDLRAGESIPAADVLYEEGQKLQREGSGLLGDKKKLRLAIEKYNEVIQGYPRSDKIDDAAYQVGLIYHRQLSNYELALLYYQRVWQWDNQTPYPVRFQVAQIYDEELHDGVQGLHYYRMSLQTEGQHKEKMQIARRRVEVLGKEISPQ